MRLRPNIRYLGQIEMGSDCKANLDDSHRCGWRGCQNHQRIRVHHNADLLKMYEYIGSIYILS